MKILLKADWLEEYSYEESLRILKELAWPHIKQSGPFADTLGDYVRRGDWVGLCDFELPYAFDADVVHIEHARQALAFFQKWEPLQLGIDKEGVAYKKFYESEASCRLTNRTLKLVRRGEFSFSPRVNGVLHTAQRKIAKVLGPVPSWAELDFGFGPGATTTTKARAVNWATKLRSTLECSTNLAPSLTAIARAAPHWFALHAHACGQESFLTDVSVGCGKLQFVPKNAKTYRSILVEPILNGFIQRGIGKAIRLRLQHAGVDLDDQSRNQALAKSGSLGDSLATVDLSSASDTISRELVYELLPLDWARFLESCRTAHISYRGVEDPRPLEKFSSMGNGFTFELESLIFWALSWGVLQQLGLPFGWLSVYGDDIVLPREAVPLLDEVFRSCGFTLNKGKSYISGPFRESCGKDYFKGIDVRPYYQKQYVSNETLFTLHNFYMRKLDFTSARRVRKLIHPCLAIFGPDGYGDGHLIGDWLPRRRLKDVKKGWEGAYFDTYQRIPRKLKRRLDCDWALPTYCVYVRGGRAETSYDQMIISGSEGYKRVSIYTLRSGIFRPY